MPPGTATPIGRGRDAEARAGRYLAGHGLKLLARNYRCRFGELDLVMQDGETVVFVEVRLRTQSRFGTPAETVAGRKQARLHAAAQHFLQRHPAHSTRPCRFDIVSFTGGDDAPQWLKDAF